MKTWESGVSTGEWAAVRGGIVGLVIDPREERLYRDADHRVGLEFRAAHPEDPAVYFENGPGGAFLTSNFHSLKHFLNFAGTGGVAKMNAIAGLP
jgi:hypothetical protein